VKRGFWLGKIFIFVIKQGVHCQIPASQESPHRGEICENSRIPIATKTRILTRLTVRFFYIAWHILRLASRYSSVCSFTHFPTCTFSSYAFVSSCLILCIQDWFFNIHRFVRSILFSAFLILLLILRIHRSLHSSSSALGVRRFVPHWSCVFIHPSPWSCAFLILHNDGAERTSQRDMIPRLDC